MMEIYGTIQFRLILPHIPASSRSRCRSLFAAIPRIARTAPIPATVFSAGVRTGLACGAE